MEKTWVSRLTPDERQELDAVLREKGDRYLSDYGDSAAWWILLLMAGLGGAVATGLQIWESWVLFGPSVILGSFTSLHGLLGLPGFIASLSLLAWIAFLWATNHRRRGFAVTSFATIRVKGRRLLLVRHADVARIEWTQVAPPRKQRFSVLRLTGTGGKTLTLYVYAGWVRTAIAQIDQTRAAADLPPIEGHARRLPE